MHDMSQRGQREIEHGKYLVESGSPEQAWNWSNPAGKLRARRRADSITRGAGLHPGLRVLEVGCGTGLFTELFANSGVHLCALDISPDLLELARKRRLPPDQVAFIAGEFESAELPGPFHAVLV
jgi:2-polyprenyl-3-methyl-5-hydroxy-6-metoxy-1,4-benzoquinol methylase